MAYVPDQIRYLQLIAEAAGWQVEILDPHSGYLAEVRSGDHRFLTGAGAVCAYPLNGATGHGIARDKAHTATLLARAGLSVPEGQAFFLRPTHSALRGPGRDIEAALAYARDLGFPVIAKPNDGSRGDGVALADTPDALRRHLERLAADHHLALVQRPLPGDEYRLFVIDDRVVYGYRRRKPELVGDGRQSVAQLLAAVTAEERAQGVSESRLDGIDGNTVLAQGQRLAYTPRANVTAGGSIDRFTETPPPAACEIAVRAAQALDLRVAGIDLIADGDLAGGGQITVLEINANPSLSGLEAIGRLDLIGRIWRDIGDRFFAEQRSRRR